MGIPLGLAAPPPDPIEKVQATVDKIEAKLAVLTTDTQTTHEDLLDQLRESEAKFRDEGRHIAGWALVVTYQDGNVATEQQHTSEKTWHLIGAVQGLVQRMIQSLQFEDG